MYITSSPDLANGTADLVSNLVVTNSAGNILPYEPVPGGDWKVQGASTGQQVLISYEVELRHGEYSWGPGIDEVAYTNDDGAFFVGHALFIVAKQAAPADISVRFELPKGWYASTPWRKTSHGLVATDMEDLLRNCFYMGTHIEEIIEIGDFTLVMAFANDLKDAKALFVGTMKPLLPAYVETFGGMPQRSRYLVVINRGDRADGGAFAGSYSLLTKGPVDETSSVIWGHGIAHELFHFWNGLTIVPASRQDAEWFKEGFTDYYTIVHRSRAGLDRPENTFRKLENAVRRFAIARMLMGFDDTLEQAGADKHRKRFIVYVGVRSSLWRSMFASGRRQPTLAVSMT